jgi:hypothetical protein
MGECVDGRMDERVKKWMVHWFVGLKNEWMRV